MRYYLIGVLAAATLGAGVTKYYWPNNVTTEIEVIRNNIVTEVREIVRPDGSKETTTVTTDKTTKKETATQTTVALKPKYHASISATRSVDALTSDKTIYGAQLDYNILGPFTVGVRADTSKQVGLVVGVSF